MKSLVFLLGVQFDDDFEDDVFCERLYQEYLNAPDRNEFEEMNIGGN